MNEKGFISTMISNKYYGHRTWLTGLLLYNYIITHSHAYLLKQAVSSSVFPVNANRLYAEDSNDASRTGRKVALFPGQGAQAIGMAVECAKTHTPSNQLFKTASEIMNMDLLKLCEFGPAASLNETKMAQPALLVASMALVRKWRDTMPENAQETIDFAAGLSLGEYSALCFSGAISFEDAVFLTRQRGMFMQEAAEMNAGGMTAVLGLTLDKANELCQTVRDELGPNTLCQVANILCPGNYAISGTIDALEKLESMGKAFGAKRLVRLQVQGAFHSQHMQHAANGLKRALEKVNIMKPNIPIIFNVDASIHNEPDVIREKLMRQLTNPVQWQKSMESLVQSDVSHGYEFGPGGVLTNIMKKIAPHVNIERIE